MKKMTTTFSVIRLVRKLGEQLSLLGCLIALPLAAQAQIAFSDFSSSDGLVLVGDAGISDGEMRITADAENQKGAVWFNAKQTVQDGFSTTFQLQILRSRRVAGEGMAFLIHNGNTRAVGRGGDGLGYAGISNSIAIEFDFFRTGEADPNSNHIAVHSLRTSSNSPTELNARLGVASRIADLNDGSVHTVKINYEAGTLDIFLNDFNTPVLTVDVELSTQLALEDGKAFVGFVASTGRACQMHKILNWRFQSSSEEDE